MRNIFFVILFCLVSCSTEKNTPSSYSKGEYIYRFHKDRFFKNEPLKLAERRLYPWEGNKEGIAKITKEYFRCKGSHLNPVKTVQKDQEMQRFYDCGGTSRHSLPLRNGKEFIYPILITLLNEIQAKTGKKVVITCGHCCPDHNLYLDSSPKNQSCKHLLGAEVDFYVQGMEQQPEKVIEILLNFYKESKKYAGMKEFQEFKRYTKAGTNVSTQPWYNKEIFIKLFKKNEGRDFDNRHPFSYVSIQVRYDWDLQETVNYSWEQAFNNMHRW